MQVRTFEIHRADKQTNQLTIVAEGMIFWDGVVALRWKEAPTAPTTVCPSIRFVEDIYGPVLYTGNAFMRGCLEAMLDSFENIPLSGIGGDLESPKAPSYITPREHNEYIRGYKTAINSRLKMQWRPMETAPRDGTVVIVQGPDFRGSAYWDAGRNIWCAHQSYDDGSLSGWMPIPSPSALLAEKVDE